MKFNKNKWVKVSDNLPKNNTPVLIWEDGFIDGNSAVAIYHNELEIWELFHTSVMGKMREEDTPTYWMPLPQAPTV